MASRQLIFRVAMAVDAICRSVRTGLDGAVNLTQALRRATSELLARPYCPSVGRALNLVSCAAR